MLSKSELTELDIYNSSMPILPGDIARRAAAEIRALRFRVEGLEKALASAKNGMTAMVPIIDRYRVLSLAEERAAEGFEKREVAWSYALNEVAAVLSGDAG